MMSDADKHSLILVADDFGLSKSVSDAIVDLIAIGVVSTTSAMMCEPDVHTLLNKYSKPLRGRCGIHLQATKSRPVLDPNLVPSIVDEDGRFRHEFPSKTYDIVELEAEWRAQLALFLKHDLGVRQIDSHHNVHLTDAHTFELAQKLAREHGARVRESSSSHSKGAAGSEAHPICIDDWSLQGKPIESLISSLRDAVDQSGSKRTIEVVTHPGWVDERLQAVSSMTREREWDYSELRKLPSLLESHLFEISK